ncbi:MAG: hypothetical protein J5965_19545, partial [Aeriscardovia sp.]|nr:hypothetical protein [Aeriscardovia sp.]
YLLGRVHSDMGEAPEALQAYYDAIESADTARDDFDYNTLIAVYGQMSRIFHEQNLPHDEIWALKHYAEYIRRNGNLKDYLMAKEQMIRPYYLLNEKDSVLNIINNTYSSLKQLGEHQAAADAIVVSIGIYLERGELAKAKRAMDVFENEAGLFDEYGNIAKGRESYYYTKGLYELSNNQLDSAEYYYRKSIKYGYLSEGYRGLLYIYRKRRDIDSVAFFSRQYEAAQDSLHNQMQIDATHRMSSLYNYSRSQKIAEQEARKARNARQWIIGILISVALAGILIFYAYRNYKRKKQDEVQKLARFLNSAKKEYQGIQEELQRLKDRDYKKLIDEKEMKGKELKQAIEELAGATGLPSAIDNLSDFENSTIVEAFRKKKDFRSDNPVPNKAEWRALEVQFSRDMPYAYKVLAKEKRLSPLEFHVCMLLILDFEDRSIVNLTDSIPQTVTTAKSRANKKIFNEKGAQTLKAGLLQLMKTD